MFIWTTYEANSSRKTASSKIDVGNETAGPGYEHSSFPFAAITTSFGGDTSKASKMVLSSNFRNMTPAFWARISSASTSGTCHYSKSFFEDKKTTKTYPQVAYAPWPS